MSVNSLIRLLMTSAIRRHKAAPIRKAASEVGRRIEELEDRATPATYNWDGSSNLTVSLGTGESLSVVNTGSTNPAYQLTLSGGADTWTATGTAADGGVTGGGATLNFNTNADLAGSITINNTGAGAGSNNVTFTSGTISSGTITVDTTTGAGTGSITDSALLTATGGGAINLTTGSLISELGSGLLSTTGTLTTSSASGTNLTLANTVGSFNATNTTSGDIDLMNTAPLTITGISESGTGNVSVTNTDDLSTTGAISTDAGHNGTISLATASTGGQETIEAAVTAGGSGNVMLTTMGLTQDVLVNAAVGSSSGTITVTATGAITEGGAGAGTFSTTGPLTTSSATGELLGNANTVGTFSATNSNSGDISLTNTAAPLTVPGITETDGGTLTINNTGAVTFSNALSGSYNLSDTSSGLTTFSAAVGSGTPLASVAVSNALAIDGGSVNTSGTQSYGGDVTLNATTILTHTGVDSLFISGTTLNLGGNTLTDAPTSTVSTGTISAQITGSGSLTESGPGTLTLTNSNNSYGTTTISAGTLQIGDGGATGSLGSGSVTDNGSLVLDLAGATTVATTISGSGSLTQGGPSGSIVILTGANSYGATTINSGTTLQIGNGGATGPLGSGAVADNGLLVFDLSSAPTVANAIAGSGSLTQEGPPLSTIILTGSNTYLGTTTVTGGTLADGSATAVPSTTALIVTAPGTFDLAGYPQTVASVTGSGTVTDSGTAATFTVNNTTTDTFAGNITGTSTALTLGGRGQTLTLSGNNTYGGATTINATDTLTAASSTALATTTNVSDNGALDLNGNSISIGALTGSGGIQNSGLAAVLSVTGGGSFSGAITGTTSGLTVGGSNTTLTLSGNNTYGGATTIDSTDTLTAASGTALTTATNVSDNGALDLNGSSISIGALTGSGGIQNSGSAAILTVTGGGSFSGAITDATTGLTVGGSNTTLALSGNNTYGGATTINSTDSLTVASSTALTTATNVSDNGTLDLNGNSISIGALTGSGGIQNSGLAAVLTVTGGGSFSGAITGTTTGLTVSGANQALTLTGTNTYLGATTVTGGTLADGSVTAVPSTTALIVTSPGTFDLAGYPQTVASVTGSGTVTDSGTAATFTVNNTTTDTFAGNITGTSTALTLGGRGQTLTLSGNNTYGGATTINSADTLIAASGTALTTATNVSDNGTLDLNGNSISIGALMGSGGIQNSGLAAILTVTGGGSFGGAITDATTGLTVSGSNTTLALSGNNTYGGATIVTGGTLADGSATAVPSTTALTVTSPGTFDLAGYPQTVASVTGSGTVTDSGTPATFTVNNSTTDTFAGNITGTSTALTLGGRGQTLTLSGNNTYGGATTINSTDTLTTASGTALTTATSVSDNGTLDLNGSSISIGALTGSGGIQNSGSAAVLTVTGGGSFGGAITDATTGLTVGGSNTTLALSGNNTYGGGTTINTTDTLTAASSTALTTATNVSDNGTLDLDGNSISIGALMGSGGIQNSSSAAVLTVTGGGLFSGAITGATTGLTVSGANQALTLTGTSTYLGATTVIASTLLVDGNDSAATGAVAVNSGGTLGGTGMVGGAVIVSTSGFITAGTAGTVGTLTVGALSFNGGTYLADFSGNASDTIVTAGAINLNSGKAGVFTVKSQTGSTTPANVYTLIKNTGAGRITNPPLSGAPEGGTITINGATTYVTYAGGNGQSFTLTASGGPSLSKSGSLTVRKDTTGGVNNIQLLQGTTVIDERPLASIPASGAYTINSTAGPTDSLTIDYSESLPVPAGLFATNIVYKESGAPARLTVKNGMFGKVAINPLSTTAETIQEYTNVTDTTPVTTITATGVNTVSDSSTSSAVVFSLGTAPNAATLADGAAVNSLMLSGATLPTTTFSDPTNSLSILRGSAADTLTINASQNLTSGVAVGTNSNPFATITAASGFTLNSGTGSLDLEAGTINLNAAGAITTNNSQTYGGVVRLGGPTTLVATTGAVSFGGSLDGPGGLTLTAPTVTFTGPVGSTTPPAAVTVNAAAAVNGGSVQTTGTQTWNGSVTFGPDTSFTAGAAVTFSKTLDGPRSLTLTAPTVIFTGPVGSTTPPAAVTVNAAAAVNGGSVQTTGTQTWNGSVTLGTDATLTAGGAVAFSNRLDGPGSLTLRAPTVTFTGPVGSTSSLAAITVNAAAAVNGGSVQTTGPQTWNGTVTLGENTSFAAGGDVTFAQSVTGEGAVSVTGATISLDASISSIGDITLNPTSGGVNQTGGALTAQHLILTGVGPFTLDQMGNSIAVGFRAAISAGSVDLAVANALTVDTADGGITTAGGNVTLRTGGDFTAIDQEPDPYSTPLIQLGSGVLIVLPGLTGPAQVQFNVEVTAAHVYLGQPGGGNNDADTFIVRPSAFTPIDVAGNLPAPPLPAGETGDVLQVLFTGATVTSFQYDGQNGYYDFAQRQPLTFTGIETLAQFGTSAFAVQTATPNDGTGATSQQYAIRVIRSQDGVTLGGGLQGSGLPPNPFVVSPALVNSITPLGSPRITFADVTGDGVQDMILANGPGAPPLVTVIDGRYLNAQANGSLYSLADLPAAAILAQFYAFDPTFLGGVNVAAGDFTGDGQADIVTAADAGGGPHIRTFELVSNGSGGLMAQQIPGLFGSFFAYDPTFRGGARVAVGDVNGDGTPDLIIGTGAGGGPRVLVYDGKTQELIRSFFAYDPSFRGGIYVAAGDYNNDGYADILTGPGNGGSANIRVFSGVDDSLLTSFFAFQSSAEIDPLFGVFGDQSGVGGVAFGAVGPNGYLTILVGTPLGVPTAVYDFQGAGGGPTSSTNLLADPQFNAGGAAMIQPSPSQLTYGSTVGGFDEGFGP